MSNSGRMSESKHTSGPWKLRITRGAENGTKHVWVLAESGGAIAELFGSAKTDDIKSEVDARKEANARLIAAAPQLLEVCKVLVDAAQHSRDWTPTGYQFLEQAKLVIAKAEGATSIPSSSESATASSNQKEQA